MELQKKLLKSKKSLIEIIGFSSLALSFFFFVAERVWVPLIIFYKTFFDLAEVQLEKYQDSLYKFFIKLTFHYTRRNLGKGERHIFFNFV